MAGAFATLVYRILVLHTMQGGSSLHFTDQEHSICYGKAAVAVNWVRRVATTDEPLETLQGGTNVFRHLHFLFLRG